MLLSDLTKAGCYSALKGNSLTVDFGIVKVNVGTTLKAVSDNFFELYKNYDVGIDADWFDFNISVKQPDNLRRFYKKQAVFKLDDHIPFKPLPLAHAYPLLEWGMNWCIANFYHNYLIFHAAVLEKNGKAIIFPAPPGSGKSTLCAYLAMNGWRLLSDEMAIIELDSLKVRPFVRPVCLKNNSISLVRDWFPDAHISNIAVDTQKGDVAHMRPPCEAVSRRYETCEIFGVVFPKFEADAKTDVFQVSQTNAFCALIENAFNFDLFEHVAFEMLSTLMPKLMLLEATYSNVEELKSLLDSEVAD